MTKRYYSLRRKYVQIAVRLSYIGTIDNICDKNDKSAVANISVHEAGHAVVYMLLFGLGIAAIKKPNCQFLRRRFYSFPHQIHRTHRSMLDMIKVYLAGGIAEEMVFGVQNASTGREHDREQADNFSLRVCTSLWV